VLLLLLLSPQRVFANGKLPQAQLYTTPKGTQFGFIASTNRTLKNQPLLVSLTGAMADTLGCNASGTVDPCYYANACEFLVPMGWGCASLDLPSHGSWVKPGEPAGIAGWRWRSDRGEDFVSEVTGRIRDMIDFSIDTLGVDAAQLAVSGISRGGFIAAHYAVSDSRVKAVGLLSPVTNLSLLTEFDGASLKPMLQPANATVLSQRNMWAIIGDQDTRVYTDAMVSLMRQVQCSGCQRGPHPEWGCTECPSRTVDNSFRVAREPLGHTVPPSSNPAKTFRQLADWMALVVKSRHVRNATIAVV